MKKTLACLSFALLFCLAANTVHAQYGLQLKVGYNANIPVGTFQDFMGKNSFRGFNGELTLPLNNKLRLGLGVSHADYWERFGREVYTTKEGQQISAVLTNSIQTTPILFKAEYTPAPKGLIRPYIEAGVGG
ncbi:MAG: hypothetical protein H7Y03_08975, partial [Chitinophagaceae bacterium]|nr:hypothetical protein [Chitinophagaceae bacterium]